MPPANWVVCEPESRELMSLLLKRIRGLGKEVRLVDAAWVWTEPHSRRLKLKLTVQKEVFAGTILQQVFVCEFVQSNEQCKDCEQFEAKDTWTAVVQVRQRVTHKVFDCFGGFFFFFFFFF
jgi:nonsense-mediated mRNA decay protein 3